ncbi:2-C-methyl-D-erythritol 2,4-cyclodiphosphate synthase [Arcanobacterium ihumii]|uniref:2-C-methyl-D-erythritol 2,4-cyclodiphosphate synthase n=1 Tax=Arcanobacterium ihumii TaxID=2138162 RepID=UPI000F51B562|nr:2-C-methyl-D-erythritol 2,4-cyclodiphosphate synthase [Arcanobacterium ihumii]
MNLSNLRVGTGVDIHAFSPHPSRKMMLACLEWPGVVGLEGHSDADVAAHAVCDALLIATGVGDLGTVFGTDQPQWAGASGAVLLAESARQIRAEGWEIANVSVQIVGEKPRFLPRKVEAEETMSEILNASVSISATTSDHLGFAGRKEGLAAIATALVYR